MSRIVTYRGVFEGTGAYPTLNRHLAAGLERRGWEVLYNQHNQGSNLAPYFISSTYPPMPNARLHQRSICLSTWEFLGKGATPRSFIDSFNTYDSVWAMCDQAAAVFKADGAQRVVSGYLGIDPFEFHPDIKAPESQPVRTSDDTKVVLWLGGTDPRHGFDLAVKVLNLLPPNYLMVAKQSIHYPPCNESHPRLLIRREDFPSVAPLYKSADVYLHTARAAAPGLSVLEALACGVRVVSTALPSVMEHRSYEAIRPYLDVVSGTLEPMKHHLHYDCQPRWMEFDPGALAQAVIEAANKPPMPSDDAAVVGCLYSWDDAAHHLEQSLIGALDDY